MLELCLITNIETTLKDEYFSFLEKVIKGGVSLIQLREKNKSMKEIKVHAKEMKDFLKPWNVPLIINDYPQIAKEVDADGVHLGNKDGNPNEVCKYLGSKKIVGVSIESYEDLDRVNKIKGLSYVTASSVFPSETKIDLKKIWGTQELANLVKKSNFKMTAIGGINLLNLKEVMNAKVAGVAIISALHKANDPKSMAEKMRKIIDESLIK